MSRVLRLVSRPVQVTLAPEVWVVLTRGLLRMYREGQVERYVAESEHRHVLLALCSAASTGLSPRYDAGMTEQREAVDLWFSEHGGPVTDHERARVAAVVHRVGQP